MNKLRVLGIFFVAILVFSVLVSSVAAEQSSISQWLSNINAAVSGAVKTITGFQVSDGGGSGGAATTDLAFADVSFVPTVSPAGGPLTFTAGDEVTAQYAMDNSGKKIATSLSVKTN